MWAIPGWAEEHSGSSRRQSRRLQDVRSPGRPCRDRLTGQLGERVSEGGGELLQQTGDVHLADAQPLGYLALGQPVSVAQPQQQKVPVGQVADGAT